MNVADMLRMFANGGKTDYEDAWSGIDWDQNRGLRRGHIRIWRLIAGELSEEVGSVAFEISGR